MLCLSGFEPNSRWVTLTLLSRFLEWLRKINAITN